ncbi:MAG: DEAD/DEAH box helicase [Xanthomonadales bacterium]|nr:DEAD/DEAH box helicase [Ahrensia sp.]MBL38294.1 DEAD/DEAH box helicase [Xanthomonadales bacterium]|tara:strand:+ start:639 stop:1301 length:663 start_codon:yes stop_codon:yes gene_type:complete
MKLSLAGNEVEMLPERAVWWPARGTAVIADVHLGKDQVFRRSGIAIPAAVLDSELAMLDSLIRRTRCERLLVLGDWVHAAPVEGESWPTAIARWRAQHDQLAIDLVLGNHDRHLSRWLDTWRIDAHLEPMQINGLAMFHEIDPEVPGAGMSGHLHPVAWLRSGREKARLPAFARRGDHLVLPAFGRFTGGFDGQERGPWKLFPIAGDRVVELPPSSGRGR